MKKVIFLFLVILNSVSYIYAQNKEGIVVYDQKINMHKHLTDESMKAIIPEYTSVKMQLAFRGPVFLYKKLEVPEGEEEMGNETGVKLSFGGDEDETYTDFEEKKIIEQKEIAGQKFLVQNVLATFPWKIDQTKKKKIQGYECVQAVFAGRGMFKNEVIVEGSQKSSTKDSTAQINQNIIAWFTNQIPTPAGPGNFSGLPGLVLEVNINDGDMVYTASKIDLKKIDDSDIKIPSKGKKITIEEFNKKNAAYLKELGVENGGSAIKVIR